MRVRTLKGRGSLDVRCGHQVSYTLCAFQPLAEILRRSKSFTFKGKLHGLSKSFMSENKIAPGEKLELELSDGRHAMIVMEASGEFIVIGQIMPALARFGVGNVVLMRELRKPKADPKPDVPKGE
jgi:hypothetical protein